MDDMVVPQMQGSAHDDRDELPEAGSLKYPWCKRCHSIILMKEHICRNEVRPFSSQVYL